MVVIISIVVVGVSFCISGEVVETHCSASVQVLVGVIISSVEVGVVVAVVSSVGGA